MRISIFMAGLALVVAGCSAKRNTWVSRHYQSLVSYFNVLHNGNEAFDRGMAAIEDGYENDYSHMLPVYEFADPDAARAGNSDMETALGKGHKLIQLHSITAKPKRKDGAQTEKQKKFRARNEYNPYVDDAFLLIVKANTVRHEGEEAIGVAEHIGREFATDRTNYEAKIWMAIALTQMGRYVSARSVLEGYDMDGLAPADLYGQYMAAYANLLLCDGKPAEALPYMENAVREAPSRGRRMRYKYILAQLYRSQGMPDKAAPLFMEISRSLHDYDMAFAAKLDLATVATSDEQLARAAKMLDKMRRDAKNADNLDQIYYSLGKLATRRHDEPAALGCFAESVARSTANTHQKGLSFLAMGDIYIARPQYIEAGESYDSASTYLNPTNPRYAEAGSTAQRLAPLVEHLKTIRTNDSLLRVASLPERERDRIIDDILRRQREREEAAEAALEAEQDEGMSQADFSSIRQGNTNSKWYFYNTTTVSAGKSAFVKKWGHRKDEDDWRRKDKSKSPTADDTGAPDGSLPEADLERRFAEAAPDSLGTQPAAEAAPDGTVHYTREQLLAGLPLTPEARERCMTAIEQSLLEAGTILAEEIADDASAAAQLERLLADYPHGKCRYRCLMTLHKLYVRTDRPADAARLAALVLAEYPQSMYAEYLRTPAFLARLEAQRRMREERYEQTYEDYLGGRFAAVVPAATRALNDTAETYRAKYLLLRALAEAKQGHAEPFRADLTAIATHHAGTPEDSIATIWLAQLDQGRQPVRATAYDSPLARHLNAEGTPQAQAAPQFELRDTTHTVICLVPTQLANELLFRIADYNFDNYLVADYGMAKRRADAERTMIVISGFAGRTDAMTYFYSLRDQRLWAETIGAEQPQIVAASDNNMPLLTSARALAAYAEFFDRHYLNR